MLFRAARQDKVITENPSEFVSATKKATTKARRPFTIAELHSVMAVADDEWRSMIRFGLYTGQWLHETRIQYPIRAPLTAQKVQSNNFRG